MNYWEQLNEEWDMWNKEGYTPEEVNWIRNTNNIGDPPEAMHFYAHCHGLDADKIMRGYKLYDNYRKNLG